MTYRLLLDQFSLKRGVLKTKSGLLYVNEIKVKYHLSVHKQKAHTVLNLQPHTSMQTQEMKRKLLNKTNKHADPLRLKVASQNTPGS